MTRALARRALNSARSTYGFVVSNKLSRLSATASKAMERSDWPEAAELWQTIARDFGGKTPASAWIGLSTSLRKQGRFGRAEKNVKQALRFYPNDLGLRNEFADISHFRSDWPEAIKRWRKILSDFDDKKRLAAVYIRLSEAYSRLGEYDKAQRVIDEAMQVHAKNVRIFIANARVATERQDWPEAAQRWRRIITDFGSEKPVTAWANLGTILRKDGRLSEAEKILKQGLRVYPNDLEIRTALAENAIDRHDWQLALSRWLSIADEIANSPEILLRVKLNARLNASVLKRLADIKSYKASVASYGSSRSQRKIAIYTSFTKGYDQLIPPEIVDKRFDYFVFSDDPVDSMGIFKVLPLNQPKFKNDGSRATRYPKTHPHVLFKDYDAAIWVDTSLMIVGDPMPMIEAVLKSGMPVGNPTHPHRQSLDEEIEACIDLKKDDPKILKKQLAFYKKIGFDTTDLANNGVLIFNLKHKKLAPVMETWWKQICTYSKRDQLSFNYALYKNKAERYRLTQPPADIRNSSNFIFVPHHSQTPLLNELYKQMRK